jgi:hypothetical protein
MVELVRHRPTKEAETDMFEPKATASHLDSTHRVISLRRKIWSLLAHSVVRCIAAPTVAILGQSGHPK